MARVEMTAKEKLAERMLLGSAVAMLVGYLGLAWAILRKERPMRGPDRRRVS